MRAIRVSRAIAALAIIAASAPAVAFNCYMIVDKSNEVIYQDTVTPVDLSDEGAPVRDALRARGQQLVVMDTDNCPGIDRARVAGKGGPATVEEIVAGMRSAASYGTGGYYGSRPSEMTTSSGIVLPRITVPVATGGGVSTSAPMSGMSVR